MCVPTMLEHRVRFFFKVGFLYGDLPVRARSKIQGSEKNIKNFKKIIFSDGKIFQSLHQKLKGPTLEQILVKFLAADS